MALVPMFPGGVDTNALEGASYATLSQAGGGFASAFSTVAALGGVGGLLPDAASAQGAAEGASPMQSLMAQALMNNLQFLDQVWRELAAVGLVVTPTAAGAPPPPPK